MPAARAITRMGDQRAFAPHTALTASTERTRSSQGMDASGARASVGRTNLGIVAELSRRNVIRVGVAYLVFAWLALQVLDVMAPILDIPAWVGKTLLVLLALGLAPVLFLSWAYELTPEGLKRTHEVTLDESITRQTGRRLDAAVVVLLVLTLGLFGWQRLHPVAPPRPAAAMQPAPAKAPGAQRRSIAVLPFRDMSPGKDQGWFADGLTEEILNSLARLPELMVTARTSAFSFKDSDRPIPEIARTLGVAYVVEGSVRRSDEKLRVTAQLVRATDGFHLWSQSYDRTADDALKVQQDIAGNVARMLDIYLDDKQRAQMFASGTHDPQAFDAFLRGRAIFADAHRTDYGLLWEANTWFENALQHDPQYARAHYMHHDAYAHTLLGDSAIGRAPTEDGKPATVESLIARMRQDLDAAVDSARDESMQLNFEIDRAFVLGDWQRLPALEQRLDRLGAPQAAGLVSGGWLPESLQLMDRTSTLGAWSRMALEENPLDPRLWFWASTAVLEDGRAGEALRLVRQARGNGLEHRMLVDAEAAALLDLGRADDALAVVDALPVEERRPSFEAFRAVLLNSSGRKDEARALADAIHARTPDHELLCWVYWELGDREQANRVAALIDQSPRLSAMRFGRLFSIAGGAPFELSATPKLAARLQSAGLKLRSYRTTAERVAKQR